MDNLSKEQIVSDYLKKQIELYKNEADFDNEYFNEQWIEETLKKIMVYDKVSDKVSEWAKKDEYFCTMSNLETQILSIILYYVLKISTKRYDFTKNEKADIIEKYLKKQLDEHKTDEDFNEELYENWVDDWLSSAVENELLGNAILQWAHEDKKWETISEFDGLLWSFLTGCAQMETR